MIDQIKDFIGLETNDFDGLIVVIAAVFMFYSVKTLFSILFYPFQR